MKLPTLTQDQKADFWSCVNKGGDCWLWLGKVYDAPVFGVFTDVETFQCLATRLAWVLTGHRDPVGRRVRNTCGEKMCVNPAHHRCPPTSSTTIRRRKLREEAKLKAKLKAEREKALEARKKTQEYKIAAEKKRRRRNRLLRERRAEKKAKRIAEKKRFREEDRQERIAARIEQIKDMILEERSR
jgi:hypothetical protein